MKTYELAKRNEKKLIKIEKLLEENKCGHI